MVNIILSWLLTVRGILFLVLLLAIGMALYGLFFRTKDPYVVPFRMWLLQKWGDHIIVINPEGWSAVPVRSATPEQIDMHRWLLSQGGRRQIAFKLRYLEDDNSDVIDQQRFDHWMRSFTDPMFGLDDLAAINLKNHKRWQALGVQIKAAETEEEVQP